MISKFKLPLLLLLLVLLSCSSEKYKEQNLSDKERAANLTSKLSLKEKIKLLGGEDGMTTCQIPRLGIPSLKFANGPNGVGDKPGTAFPNGVAMAATWDEKLMHEIGVAIGKEARAKKIDIVLGPCVNIHRMPIGGRNFESYSEDPFLSGRMGVNFVKGVQESGVATSLKHYALNNQEASRGSYDALVDERALREIYLSAFEMVVKEAKPMTVMAAYNKFRGEHCTQNKYLLTDILRNEWGFEGFVMSDWDATHSTVPAAKAGLDLEMPGKPKYFNEKLLKAVKEGRVKETEIDEKVSRILSVYFQMGIFDDKSNLQKGELDTPEHRALAARTAREAIVLLKNNNKTLPLKKEKIKSIAVIGPNANINRIGGGGSSEVIPFYSVSPLDGLKNKVGKKVKLNFLEGVDLSQKDYDVIDTEYLIPPKAKKGEHGLQAEYFNNETMSGKPVVTRIDKKIDFNWGQKSPDEKILIDKFSARWTGKLIAPKSGKIRIGVKSNDGSYLYINNLLVVNNWGMHGPKLKSTEIEVEKGNEYDIKIEYYEGGNNASVMLGWQLEKEEKIYDKNAVEMAMKSDVAIIFTGLTPEWEGEGFDRENMDLPGAQDELINAIAKVNSNTIVVINSGTPVTMTKWIDKVPVVVQAWYLGQETGNAVSDVLFGDYNPSGKLPVTFPGKYEDNPAYSSYNKEKDKAVFEEGIFVGYRYYDSNNVKPLFPFGYGLSYTSFEFSNLKLSSPSIGKNDELIVEVTVENTGRIDGDEIVQLYISDKNASVEREVKSLKGFARVSLKAGESKTISFKINKNHLSFYDVKKKKWIVEPGEFDVLIGASSRDIRMKETFRIR